MRINAKPKKGSKTVERVIYDDIYGVSELFQPKIWIDFFAEDMFFIKTLFGEKIPLLSSDLRQLNLKMIKLDIGTTRKPLYKRYMSVNSPRKAAGRIPLLSISKKLNKIWRGCINVEREYEKRWEYGYRGWCPKS